MEGGREGGRMREKDFMSFCAFCVCRSLSSPEGYQIFRNWSYRQLEATM